MTAIDLPSAFDRHDARTGRDRALRLLRKGADGKTVAPAAIDLPAGMALTEEVRIGLARANGFVLGALATSTTEKYAKDWSLFVAWCLRQDLAPLPCAVGTLAAFLGHHAGPHRQTVKRRNGKSEEVDNTTGLSPQRLEGYRAAIRWVHDLAGEPTPTGDRLISRLMLGAKRAWETPKRKSLAITTYGGGGDEQGLLQRMAAGIDASTITGIRDRALLLTGFYSAMRRRELCELKLGHIDKSRPSGWLLRIPRSKGDKRGEGQTASLPRRDSELCPVAALDAWIEAGRRLGAIVGGEALVFRAIDRWGHVSDTPMTPVSVALIYKRLAERAGLSEEEVKAVSGHSTRAGYANSAILSGATIPEVMAKLRHKDPKALMEYMRAHDLLDDAVDEAALDGKRSRKKRSGAAPDASQPDAPQ